MHFSRSRRRQLFRGNGFSALGRNSCIYQWQYQNGFLVQALCPVSPSRQQSSLLGLQAEALHTQINKTPPPPPPPANKPREKHPQHEIIHFSRSRRRQLFRGNSFSALGRNSCIYQWQYQNGFLVQALCPVSPSRQQSSLLGLQAEALHTQINKTPPLAHK